MDDTEVYRLATIAARLWVRAHPAAAFAYDDLLSAASLGASQARAALTPGTPGPQARAYVMRRAQGAVIDDLRARHPGSRSENRPAAAIHLADLATDLRSEDDELERVEQRAVVDTALAHLTDRERCVVIATIAQGATDTEVGAALGVTASRVSQIRAAALAKARRAAA